MQLGIDVGGTFTDLLAHDPDTGQLSVFKIPTTNHDQSEGFLNAVRLAVSAGAAPAPISSICHGSTVAINALLERKGCRAASVSTRGFRDTIELRRRDRPAPYGLRVRFEPLIPRDLRFEVGTRIDVEGRLLVQESAEEIDRIVAALHNAQADLLVISLFNGFRNTVEEQRLAAAFDAAGWPLAKTVIATDISREIREFDRTGTAVASAYIKPAMERYLVGVDAALKNSGIHAPFLVAQSNGAVAHWRATVDNPIGSLMSGPAAGAVAATATASMEGFENAIACDIGGTSTDITIIADGAPHMRRAHDIDFGLPILCPMIDVRSIGAGGGSIARLDRGNILQVGPESAGARPGPAAYGTGGEQATVTDAQLILGILPDAKPLGTGGGMTLSVELAAAAIDRHVASPLGIPLRQAAQAILTVAQHNICAAIKKLVTEKGQDPATFALVVYGGGGASHACALMRELGIRTAIVPPFSGAISALGCLLCDLRMDQVRSIHAPLGEPALELARSIWDEQAQAAADQHRATGIPTAPPALRRSLWCCYAGQSHSIEIEIDDPADATDLTGRFERAYHARFGLTLPGFPIMATAVQSVSIATRLDRFHLQASQGAGHGRAAALEHRALHLGGTTRQARLLSRADIKPGRPTPGPVIIEDPDSTILIETGFTVDIRPSGSLVIARETPESEE